MTGGRAGRVFVHALAAAAPPRLLSTETGAIHRLQVDPLGERVLVATRSQVALLGLDGRPRIALAGPSPAGKTATTTEGDVTSGDIATATAAHPPQNAFEVLDARFSADGARIVVAGSDHKARVFEAKAPHAVRTLLHPAPVQTADFAPQGDRVATAAADGKARVFSVQDGALRLEIEPRRGVLTQVAWSPDGRHLGLVSGSGYVHVERVRRWPEVVQRLRELTTACLATEVRRAVLGEDAVESALRQARCERAAGR